MKIHLLVWLLVLLHAGARGEASRPNFVFFLVDDLGYADIGANNPDCFYETPHIDRLAGEGMRFTNGYAANPVCSPTRFSIMTGRYPSRVDATNFFSGRRAGRFAPAPLHSAMPLGETTLAEVLKSAGYRTAFLGKWHLGPSAEYWPENQGFDINVGGFARGAPPGGYFAPYRNPRLEDGPDGEHLTDRLTDEAVAILQDFKDEPFLLYLSFYTVHTPLQAPPDLVARYRDKARRMGLDGLPEFAPEEQIWPGAGDRRVRIRQRHATYAAMVETLDRSVGRITKALRDLGLEDDTTVLFTSDNGGLSTSEGSPTSNLPLRGGKGWLYEGGIREPWIVKWPGRTPPGSVCHTPVMSIDFLPTMMEMAGIEPHPVDGVSLVPLLARTGPIPERDLFWHYPHYSNQGGFPGGAVRRGDFKLLERFEDGSLHLHNLQADIGERANLAPSMPRLVESMRQSLHAWYREVDAKFLQPLDGGPRPWRPGSSR